MKKIFFGILTIILFILLLVVSAESKESMECPYGFQMTGERK